jgi:hypothetical protein
VLERPMLRLRDRLLPPTTHALPAAPRDVVDTVPGRDREPVGAAA